MTYSYENLLLFVESVFEKSGCQKENTQLASQVLLSADLRGIDSHGIARLPGYIRLLNAGRATANPQMCILHETPSTAVLDGDMGWGLLVAPYAMQIAIQKAKNVGTGWVSVQNSNHFGVASYHAMMALEHDMIGIAMTNASALVAPTFGKEKMLGTNPIAMAVPADKEPPFVADLATTTVANGKLEILQIENSDAPKGWVQDNDGKPSQDAHILKKGGALLPLGSDRLRGSHKGYALGSIVDILSAVLSGASFGPWVPPFPAYVPLPENMPGKGVGHFLGAMRIDAFRPADDFKKNMDIWIKKMRGTEPIDPNQKVIIPGDPERLIEEERKKNGIPIEKVVENNLIQLAQDMNLKHPFNG